MTRLQKRRAAPANPPRPEDAATSTATPTTVKKESKFRRFKSRLVDFSPFHDSDGKSLCSKASKASGRKVRYRPPSPYPTVANRKKPRTKLFGKRNDASMVYHPNGSESSFHHDDFASRLKAPEPSIASVISLPDLLSTATTVSPSVSSKSFYTATGSEANSSYNSMDWNLTPDDTNTPSEIPQQLSLGARIRKERFRAKVELLQEQKEIIQEFINAQAVEESAASSSSSSPIAQNEFVFPFQANHQQEVSVCEPEYASFMTPEWKEKLAENIQTKEVVEIECDGVGHIDDESEEEEEDDTANLSYCDKVEELRRMVVTVLSGVALKPGSDGRIRD